MAEVRPREGVTLTGHAPFHARRCSATTGLHRGGITPTCHTGIRDSLTASDGPIKVPREGITFTGTLTRILSYA